MKITLRNKVGKYIHFNVYAIVKITSVPIKDREYSDELTRLISLEPNNIKEIIVEVEKIEDVKNEDS